MTTDDSFDCSVGSSLVQRNIQILNFRILIADYCGIVNARESFRTTHYVRRTGRRLPKLARQIAKLSKAPSNYFLKLVCICNYLQLSLEHTNENRCCMLGWRSKFVVEWNARRLGVIQIETHRSETHRNGTNRNGTHRSGTPKWGTPNRGTS